MPFVTGRTLLTQMSRIASTFRALGRQRRTALVTFVTAGDPDPATTPDIMHALVRHGADLLELGVPCSDPMADGVVIRRAHERALAHEIAPADVLEMVAQFRRTDSRTPVIVMSYACPVEAFGYGEFAARAAAAGVDGVIVVDMPPERAALFNRQLRARAIDQIFLVTPVTTARHVETIIGMASGFVYYVSVTGTTGGKQPDAREVAERLRLLRNRTELPLAVGFGIKDAATAARLAGDCDAIIIGSALVERIHDATQAGEDIADGIGTFMAPVRYSLDRAA